MFHNLLNWPFRLHLHQGRDAAKGDTPPVSSEALFEQLEQRVLLSAVDITSLDAVVALADGVIVRQISPQATGTGVIETFVRIQNDGTEQGYNTDLRPLPGGDPVQVDVNTSPEHTRSLLLSDVPLINIAGIPYREFRLDINEMNKSGFEFISLDEVQIFQGTAGDLVGYPTFGGDATKVYDLDALADMWIMQDYSLNSGSGSGDMIFYVPDSVFIEPGDFVYLYSSFGAQTTDPDGLGRDWSTEDGFEEWFVGASPFGEIHGYKFNDLNGNGVDDDEPRLSGWTFFLDADDDGVLDASEVSTVTDENGEYHFTELISGLGEFSTYRVREVSQTGWAQTTVDPVDFELTEAGQIVVAFAGQVAIGSGQTEIVRSDLAFGNIQLRSIFGRKFEDHAGDGNLIPDDGDQGLAGWTIQLYEDTNDDGVPQPGELIDSTVTTLK
ncbi:hypothetical protein LCGC14_1712880, partial [marine sediment metagenome]